MSKRALPPGVKCGRALISITPADHAYLRRRVVEARAAGERFPSVSGEIRKAIHGDRRRRHDLRQPLNALAMAEQGFRAGAIDTPTLLATIRKAVAEMGEILAPVQAWRRRGEGEGPTDVVIS